jgi:hypothetical protein
MSSYSGTYFLYGSELAIALDGGVNSDRRDPQLPEMTVSGLAIRIRSIDAVINGGKS